MKNLTTGKPIWVIIHFMLPILFSGIFQQLYGIADTMIVGQVLGESSIAAIGATTAVYGLLSGFLRGTCNGFGLVIARFFGAGKEEEMRRAIAGTILLTLLLTIAITAAGLLSLPTILATLRTPTEIIEQSQLYLGILFTGLFFSSFYNMCSSTLLSTGDSKTPMYFLIASVCVNILLDFVMIAWLRLGIGGAAAATVISQLLSAVLVGLYIWRRIPQLIPKRHEFSLRQIPLKDLSGSGLAMGLIFCIVDVGTVAMQGAINDLGTLTVAAHTAARKIIILVCMFLSAVEAAVATFTSQNHGAGQQARIREGIRQAMFLNFTGATVVMVVTFLFERQIITGLTGSHNKELLDAASLCLRVNAPFFYVLSIFFVLRSALQGMGGKLIPILSSVIELLAKFAAVWILAPRLGYLGICITEPIAWSLCTLLLVGQSVFRRWRTKGQEMEEPQCK